MHFQFREKERPDDFVSNLAGRIRVCCDILIKDALQVNCTF